MAAAAEVTLNNVILRASTAEKYVRDGCVLTIVEIKKW